ELLDSAAILHHVPAHPARNFKEACQAFYLFQLALQLDNGSYAVNPQGADIALLPYFQRDINSGALNTQQAYEIVECLWFKL
ncbi:pyruvate formate lyase family protein, partial [Klebsiella pneumoniae]|nr:pyruvate formate lyase family protein [Klebsiella pneumoniae]